MDTIEIISLAEAFRDCLAGELTEREIAEIKRRNATPQYAGGICASHDFVDANMTMARAFEKITGRFPLLPSDFEDDDAEGQRLLERQAALWSAAWAYAKDEYLSEKGNRDA